MAELTIENLRKAFGRHSVLKGIDLALEDGEFLVLLGPSGCGKTTLLNVIAGLEQPTDGVIRIDGRVVNDIPPKDRDIAMVFQTYALYPSKTVAGNIAFSLRLRGVSKSACDEAVLKVARMLKIEQLLDRRPAQLSGGQRQRVAMGRALVRNPEIFLFDEPLSSLDAKMRAEMRQEIRSLHQKLGTTVVYVTHDQHEAMALADRIALLRDGQIQQCAAPQTIYDHPANMFVASFIGSPPMNFIPATISTEGERLGIALPPGLPEQGETPFLPLPSPSPRLLDWVGAPVILGLRAEAIQRQTGQFPDNGTSAPVRCRVGDGISTGADLLSNLELGRQPVVARLSPKNAPEPGSVETFVIDMTRINLFDPGSENRIAI
jgi:multiple sugar transport system ATP-binding protein